MGYRIANCSPEKEEICLCKDCAVANCERYNCQECEAISKEQVHEVFCCNSFREIDCSR